MATIWSNDFEDGTLQDFVADDSAFEVKTDHVRGSYSAGITSSAGLIGHAYPFGEGTAKNPDTFEHYWLEESSSRGGGLQLIDSDGNMICGFATDNPEWELDDGDGNTEIYAGDGYERWIYVKFTFDWDNGQYDYYVEDLQSGHTESGTRSLKYNTNIERINLHHFESGSWSSQSTYMWWDDFAIELEEFFFYKATYATYLEMLKEVDYVDDTLKLALLDDTFAFDKDKHKVWTASAWQSDTSCSSGDIVIPTTANGYVYRATNSGTSGSSEPTWIEDDSTNTWGDTVSDNTVTWELWSYDTSYWEITQENGYSGPVTLSNQAVTETEADDGGEFTCDDETITATGSVGPTAGAVFFDDTHTQKPVIVGIEYSETTLSDTETIEFQNIKMINQAV